MARTTRTRQVFPYLVAVIAAMSVITGAVQVIWRRKPYFACSVGWVNSADSAELTPNT